MAEPAFPQELTIWTDGQRAPLAEAILREMGQRLAPLAVGGPRQAPVDRLAQTLDKPRHDDLRKLLVDHPAGYLLVTSMAGIYPQDLLTAREQRTVILTLEPAATSLEDLRTLGRPTSARGAGKSGAPHIVLMPAFLQSPGFQRASEPDQNLGPRRLISIQNFALPDHGSLLARLFDSWQTVLHFAGLPESIDASLAGANTVPEELRQAGGRLAAHARMADGSGAVLAVADAGGGTPRRLEVLGQQAHLTATDNTYQLHHADGREIDSHTSQTPAPEFVTLVADQWRGLMERPSTNQPTADPAEARALACCQASVLSARTGQPEAPAKLLEMRR